MSGGSGARTPGLAERLRATIRDIPDFPKPGIVFKDITPVLLEPSLFRDTVAALADWTGGRDAEKILGVDARGFLFAGPVADRLGLGLVPVRKPGKLPFDTYSFRYDLEYGSDTLEMHVDGVPPGTTVLVVDDLLATGGTVGACVKLLEKTGARIAGCAFAIELVGLGGAKAIAPHPVFSLIKYD
jgi:adenine phosphoribosyltransferase